jgi:RNA 3'-terminal phosphate cyclase (ATP)
MTDRATRVLRQAGLKTEITPKRVRGAGPGAGLQFLIAEYERALGGFSSLGELGKPSERVADEACQHLLEFQACAAAVEKHLGDQLLLLMALADGRSEFDTSAITPHLLSNAHVIQQFLPAPIQIDGNAGLPGRSRSKVALLRPKRSDASGRE